MSGNFYKEISEEKTEGIGKRRSFLFFLLIHQQMPFLEADRLTMSPLPYYQIMEMLQRGGKKTYTAPTQRDGLGRELYFFYQSYIH